MIIRITIKVYEISLEIALRKYQYIYISDKKKKKKEVFFFFFMIEKKKFSFFISFNTKIFIILYIIKI